MPSRKPETAAEKEEYPRKARRSGAAKVKGGEVQFYHELKAAGQIRSKKKAEPIEKRCRGEGKKVSQQRGRLRRRKHRQKKAQSSKRKPDYTMNLIGKKPRRNYGEFGSDKKTHDTSVIKGRLRDRYFLCSQGNACDQVGA